MVGDGLNDAPALAAAHASLSPASAADISQTAADANFQGEALTPVLETIAVARVAQRMALQNFAISIGSNLIFVPLAVIGYRYAVAGGNCHVGLIVRSHHQCRAFALIASQEDPMTALAGLIPCALILGAAGLAAFLSTTANSRILKARPAAPLPMNWISSDRKIRGNRSAPNAQDREKRASSRSR
jgi:hypothetical protein